MLSIHCCTNYSFGPYLFTLISALAYLSRRPGPVFLVWLLALDITILPTPSKWCFIHVCGYPSPDIIDNNSICRCFSPLPSFLVDSFIILTSDIFQATKSYSVPASSGKACLRNAGLKTMTQKGSPEYVPLPWRNRISSARISISPYI